MRYKYSVNRGNQLLIKKSRLKKPLLTNGKFDINKDNRLVYWLNEPLAWRTRYNLPGRIAFEGKWQLNPNYDLELVLDETKEQFKGDRLVLKGEIISTDEDVLVFEMVSYNKGLSPTELKRSYAKGTVPELHIQLLKLSGFWKADEANRLNFVVEKKVSPDTLFRISAPLSCSPTIKMRYRWHRKTGDTLSCGQRKGHRTPATIRHLPTG